MNIVRLGHTLKRLKLPQVYGKIFQKLRLLPVRRFYVSYEQPLSLVCFRQFHTRPLCWSDNSFTFLNYRREWEDSSRFWLKNEAPKLWAYHLHYFDDLGSLLASKDEYNFLIDKWIEHCNQIKGDAWESYTVSRRIRNWVKWFLKSNELNEKRLTSLAKQISFLSFNLETFIQANHLLTNLVAIMMGQTYFQGRLKLAFSNDRLEKLLISELDEQFLEDGTHYELSPMYQSLILEELIDLYAVLSEGSLFPTVLKRLKVIIPDGLVALSLLSRPNGYPSHFNDSTGEIALRFKDLLEYSKLAGFDLENFKSLGSLNDAGYFRIGKRTGFTSLIDAGDIRCSYQPGHTHADTLSFETYWKDELVFINPGVSTYDVNETRVYERGATAHNCLVVDNRNMIDIWSSFRVGKSSQANVISYDSSSLLAEHNGYREIGGNHKRHFSIEDFFFKITDYVHLKKEAEITLYFHLHPDVKVESMSKITLSNGDILYLELDGSMEWSSEQYKYSESFGVQREAIRIVGKAQVKQNISIETLVRGM